MHYFIFESVVIVFIKKKHLSGHLANKVVPGNNLEFCLIPRICTSAGANQVNMASLTAGTLI